MLGSSSLLSRTAPFPVTYARKYWALPSAFRARRGQNATRFATGELATKATELMQLGAAELSIKHTGSLNPQQRAGILREFEHGRAHLMQMLTIKASPFGQLPLKVLGLGHPNRQLARRNAAECLRLWVGLSAQERLSAHSVVKALCEEGSAGRVDMIMFVRRGLMQGRVTRARHDYMFAPNNEVPTERKHSDLHGGVRLAPHHSPAFASCQL